MLQVDRFFRHSRMLLRHCFDIVAVFGNNVDRNVVLSTKWKQIEHVQFVSTLSKGRNFVRHCCQKRQQCRSNVEATFDFVESTQFYDKLVRHCCHFWQQSRMLLVWTRLKTMKITVQHWSIASDRWWSTAACELLPRMLVPHHRRHYPSMLVDFASRRNSFESFFYTVSAKKWRRYILTPNCVKFSPVRTKIFHRQKVPSHPKNVAALSWFIAIKIPVSDYPWFSDINVSQGSEGIPWRMECVLVALL